MLKILSIPLTILAYTLLSTGFVLMKKGISWIGYKGKKDKPYFRDLFTWVAGFLLINLYIVPNTIALKALDPHIVSAMAGWGVIVLVFLSKIILGEKLFRSDYYFTLLIFISIVILNVFEYQEAGESVNTAFLLVSASLPFLLFIPAFIKTFSKKTRALLFAAVSGISTGMIIVTLKIVVSDSGFFIREYFSSPYFYLYLLFSITAFLSLQIAYKMGLMMIVGPVQYSAAIIYPALCSFLIFGNHIHPVQPVAILGVIISVTVIHKKCRSG